MVNLIFSSFYFSSHTKVPRTSKLLLSDVGPPQSGEGVVTGVRIGVGGRAGEDVRTLEAPVEEVRLGVDVGRIIAVAGVVEGTGVEWAWERCFGATDGTTRKKLVT